MPFVQIIKKRTLHHTKEYLMNEIKDKYETGKLLDLQKPKV